MESSVVFRAIGGALGRSRFFYALAIALACIAVSASTASARNVFVTSPDTSSDTATDPYNPTDDEIAVFDNVSGGLPPVLMLSANIGGGGTSVTGTATTDDGAYTYVAFRGPGERGFVEKINNISQRIEQVIDVGYDPKYLTTVALPDGRHRVLVARSRPVISVVESSGSVHSLRVPNRDSSIVDIAVSGIDGGGKRGLALDGGDDGQNKLWVINNLDAADPADLSIAAKELDTGPRPGRVEVSAVTGQAFVTSVGPPATVNVINRVSTPDPADIKVDPNSIQVNSAPWGLATSPNRAELYVSHIGGFNILSVIDIDRSSNTYKEVTEIGGAGGYGVGVTANGLRAFVVNGINNSVDVVDLKERRVKREIQITSPGNGPQTTLKNPRDIAVAGGRAYLGNNSSSDVTVLDNIEAQSASAISVQATIGMGRRRRGVAFSPDGSEAYAVNTGGDETQRGSVTNAPDISDLLVIDAETRRVKGTVTGLGPQPYSVAAQDDFILVTEGESNTVPTNTVSVIDRSSYSVVERIEVDFQPRHIAISSNGKRAFVSNRRSATVSVIDLDLIGSGQNLVVKTVGVSASPEGLALTPDGKELWVVSAGSDRVNIVEDADASDPADIHVDSSYTQVGPNPEQIVISSDGTRAYVTNSGSAVGTVSAIDVETRTAVAGSPYNVLRSPMGIALDPDGETGHIANFDGQFVSDLDTSEGAVAETAHGIDSPHSVAVRPNQGPIASFGLERPASGAGVPIEFDGSQSTDPDPETPGPLKIRFYRWDFGDGTVRNLDALQGEAATPPHTYEEPGEYEVSLQVTDAEGASTERVQTDESAAHNGSSAAVSEKVVQIPPSTTVVSGPPSSTGDTTASFQFATDSESPQHVYECSLDGAAFTTCFSAPTFSGLAAGAHTLAVRGVLPNGNVEPTPEQYAWSVTASTVFPPFGGPTPGPSPASDREAPKIKIKKLSKKRLRRSTFRGLFGTASDNVAVSEVRYRLFRKVGRRCQNLRSNGRLARPKKCGRGQTLRAKGTTNWKTAKLKRVKTGRYTIEAYAVDRVGNRSATARRNFKLRR